MQTLIESEFLDADDVPDKSCEGYSIIFYDEDEGNRVFIRIYDEAVKEIVIIK